MKMKVNDVSKLTGVSVRTLHYYDEMGLLKPSEVDDENGYRYYDTQSLRRLQEILFYRELDFPLKTIKMILNSPNYDKEKALSEQKQLLIIKKQRFERIIALLDNNGKGQLSMEFKEFDNTEYENARNAYAKEAKEKWGNTQAYNEFEAKTKENSNTAEPEMDALIGEFAQCMKSGAKPADKEAQALVCKWKKFISENYYTCTDEILSSLGEMYVGDERFKSNIDRHGEGTAQFMNTAITSYCENK